MRVVIPAAGRGTRFLPATRAMPKEMLPLLNKPVIEYVVEQAIAAGFDDILLITGKNKRAIEDHFEGYGGNQVHIHFMRQAEPLGLANALLLGLAHTGADPFAVLLGDTVYRCATPILTQLWREYERLEGPVVAVRMVPWEKQRDYGIVEGDPLEGNGWRLHTLIEKPVPGLTDSRLALVGAYILTPEIYPALAATVPGANGELQLTDALKRWAADRPLYATLFEGELYDIGDPASWLEANLTFARRDPVLRVKLQGEIEKWASS